MSDDTPKKKPFFTKRVIFTVLAMALAQLGLYSGKLAGDQYVILMLGCIAGHHLADYIKAWKGRD